MVGFFNEGWTSFLRSYGFIKKPEVNFYDTAAKTISLLSKQETDDLNRALQHKDIYVDIAPVRVLPFEYDCLFDGTLNLLVTDQYNEQNLLSVYRNVITYNRLRQSIASSPAASATQSESITDQNVVDISDEGGPIDYGNVPPATSAPVSADNAPSYYEESAKLGNKFREKLYLSGREVEWLNKFWNPDNIFLSIEGCCIAVIRLYLICIKAIDKEYKQQGSSIEDVFNGLIKQVLTTVYKGQTSDYSYYENRIETDIYLTIFKRAENTIREAYSQKRKISDGFPYDKLSENFESAIGCIVLQTIAVKAKAVPPPDRVTEILLNAQSNSRWRTFFEVIEQKVRKDNYATYVTEMLQLAALNINNPQKETIYFEASKLFAPYDRLEAVRFYLRYLHTDLRSETIDNKPLPKTIHKNLFKTEGELQAFESVANTLILTHNLKDALEEAPFIFIKKKKKVQLDAAAIEAVIFEHATTVNVLNELLQDDENEAATIAPEEASVNLIPAVVEISGIGEITWAEGVNLNMYQQELIILFKANSLSLTSEVVGSFAKEKKLFRDQLIESINDTCYEKLDDLLIEEYDDSFLISELSFKTITI